MRSDSEELAEQMGHFPFVRPSLTQFVIENPKSVHEISLVTPMSSCHVKLETGLSVCPTLTVKTRAKIHFSKNPNLIVPLILM